MAADVPHSSERQNPPIVPLDEVIVTSELDRRQPRPPDYEWECRTLEKLVQEMADPDSDVLQNLTAAAMVYCRAHSAGISLLEKEGGEAVFRWVALSGRWTPYLGDTMPRSASPCGTVVDRDASLLMSRPERHFRYEAGDMPPIVETLLVPFRSSGEPIGTLWVVAHDETTRFDAEDRRLLESLARVAAAGLRLRAAREAAERSSRSKNDFLSVMSHELRNPLNAIQGFVALMSDGLLGPVNQRQRDALTRTRKTAYHLVTLVDEILLFSGVESGRQALRPSSVDVAELARDMVDMHLERARAKRLEIRFEAPEESVRAISDEAKLRHALDNLVGNAVKYTMEGTVSVAVDGREDEVLVRVTDTGPGIPPERLEDIFEPFERLEPAGEHEPQEGTGLGLAIARSMAHALGGDVTAESRVGEGSVFTFRLPRSAPPEGERSAPLGSSTPAPWSRRTSPRSRRTSS